MTTTNPIFRDTSIPRNVQLANLFRQRIVSGEWPVGHKLPTLEELVKQFGVARFTMRQAIERLGREGLVLPQQGRGTIVTAKPPTNRWLTVQTSLDDLDEVYMEIKPELHNLEESTRSAPVTESDGQSAKVYRWIRRVHSREGVPYCIISTYIDDRIFRRAASRFRTHVVIGVLRSIRGVEIARGRQTLTIDTANLEVASHLKMSLNAPIAIVRRVFNDPTGVVICLTELTYRGDFVRLDMDIRD